MGLTCHQEGGAGAKAGEGVAGAKGMLNGGWGRGLGWQGGGGAGLKSDHGGWGDS